MRIWARRMRAPHALPAPKLVEAGAVAINGETCLSKKQQVAEGDRISIELPEVREPGAIIPQAIPLDIRYEDDYLIVLSKQRGLVCHPAHGHEDGTLANALRTIAALITWATVQGEDRPGIVHRLDRDTSGSCSPPRTMTRSAPCRTSSARVRSTVAISRSSTARSSWTRGPSTRVLRAPHAIA